MFVSFLLTFLIAQILVRYTRWGRMANVWLMVQSQRVLEMLVTAAESKITELEQYVNPVPTSTRPSKFEEIVWSIFERYCNSSLRFRLMFSIRKQRENESPNEYASQLKTLAQMAFSDLDSLTVNECVRIRFLRGLREMELFEYLTRFQSLELMLVEFQQRKAK